jgi:hypothetical protein
MREIRLVEVYVGGEKWWMPIGYIDGKEVYRGERRVCVTSAFQHAFEWLVTEVL